MGITLTILLEHLDAFDGTGGMDLHGANLSIPTQVRAFARHESVTEIEIYLPAGAVVKSASLSAAAAFILPLEKQGKGVLGFFPFQAIPERWADGKPRLFWSIDPGWLSRDRYLRDRFATGPMPISCDTHSLAFQPIWNVLAMLAEAPPVPFDAFLALSRDHKIAFERSFKALGVEPPMRMEIIARGVNLEMFQPSDASRKSFARDLLRLPKEARIALFLGRLSPHAKADLLPLVESFARVSEAGDLLVMAGVENVEGYVAKLMSRAKELGIIERVRIHTTVEPSMRSLYYSAADIFVFPGDTVQEALGNTVLEAMASGLPTIASDWDGFKDTVEHEVTGLRVPTWIVPGLERIGSLSPAVDPTQDYLFIGQNVWIDPSAWDAAMTRLLRSPETCAKFGNEARRQAEAKYSRKTITEHVVNIWASQLAQASQESPDAKSVRKGYASKIGHPQPFLDTVGHYGTGVIDPQRFAIAVTDFGRDILSQKARLTFYDETLAALRPEVVQGVLEILRKPQPTLLEDVLRSLESSTRASRDEILFHVGLFAKRDVLRFQSRD